jgi:aminopeptidase N
MENPGAVTFAERFVFRSRVTDAERERRASVILHEMAHMWFGDLVTMRWWDDLWLNESFATWASAVAQAEATRWPHAWTTFSQGEKAFAYRQDQLPSTHPVSADIGDIAAVEVNFDDITYAKGASVLRQLVAYVGQDNFLAGVRAYFARHAWGNAALGDLLDALEQASGRELAGWSKAWLETAGVNTLRPAYQVDGDGSLTEFAVLQEAPAAHPVLRPHRIAIGLYDRGGGALTRRRRVELDVTGERTEVPELIGERRPDLVLVNDDDLTFAKVRLDQHSLRTLIGAIGDFADPLPAAICLATAWDMCRDAEMPARDYVALVLSAVPSITDISVLQMTLGRAAGAVRRFADPGWRDTGLARLAAALRRLMAGAEPGSDAQLAFAQAFASVATTVPDLQLLAGLLDGSRVIDGLAVDTDLRWRLLGRLVSRGAAGPDAIDAEHERDRTDAGDRYAQACLAAVPGQQAKEAAWARLTSGELNGATFRAVLGGFQAADSDDLLAPFTARFFDVIADAWRDWSLDMAQYFAEYGYPRWQVTAQAIDMAAGYLARSSPPAPLHRLIDEGRDDVVRAMRCRERDAQAG